MNGFSWQVINFTSQVLQNGLDELRVVGLAYLIRQELGKETGEELWPLKMIDWIYLARNLRSSLNPRSQLN